MGRAAPSPDRSPAPGPPSRERAAKDTDHRNRERLRRYVEAAVTGMAALVGPDHPLGEDASAIARKAWDLAFALDDEERRRFGGESTS